jgi:hypothetical protein
VRHAEAFLQQGGEMLLAQPLAPARQGRPADASGR